MKKLHTVGGLLLIVALLCSMFSGCNTQSTPSPEDEIILNLTEDQYPEATITFEGYSEPVVVRLDPVHALNTVKNFISLAQSGYYDGLTIHRVTNFCIQGGSKNGDGTGGPGYTIKGEFTSNGFDNPLKHEKGTISMARTSENDSADSQFFICTRAASSLDGEYAAFGEVIDGMYIVLAIAQAPHDSSNGSEDGKPLEDIVISSIEIDTKGITYPEPNKIPE